MGSIAWAVFRLNRCCNLPVFQLVGFTVIWSEMHLQNKLSNILFTDNMKYMTLFGWEDTWSQNVTQKHNTKPFGLFKNWKLLSKVLKSSFVLHEKSFLNKHLKRQKAVQVNCFEFCHSIISMNMFKYSANIDCW